MKVCVLGRGKVGRGLTAALRHSNCQVNLVKGHPPWPNLPRADAYILAVPDGALRELGARLGPQLPKHACVFHCAGARGPEELAPLRDHGAHVATLHPLVSFADLRRPPSLRGASFVAHGDRRALKRAKELTHALQAHCVLGVSPGAAYHAAAALVANATAALTGTGVDVLEELGFSRITAARALSGLLRSVADNVERVGLPQALTGPVVRGDAATVEAHLNALERLDPSAARAYLDVQSVVLACAEKAGLSSQAARRVRRVLKAGAQRKT